MIPTPAVGYLGAGFFVAGFSVLRRVLGMKAGQSKLKRVLGIIAIFAFIGFFIKNFETLMAILNHPGEFINAFLDDPIGFTVYMFFALFLGVDSGGA